MQALSNKITAWPQQMLPADFADPHSRKSGFTAQIVRFAVTGAEMQFLRSNKVVKASQNPKP